MEKRSKPKDMSRDEQIKQETQLALEHNLSPHSPVSLDRNFRVEGITPTMLSSSSTLIPSFEVACRNDLDFQDAIPRSVNPYRQLASPEALRMLIESELKSLTSENRELLLPRILEQLGDAASQLPDAESIASLHKKVLITMFGEEYFKNVKEAGHKVARKPNNK
ncbi:MAG TPA: hypothetical protein VNE38_04770 [Ktedonobacteraceae bacterium]|nr:hypothetical protein [Ktedonobacteraceae bacterium]